MNAADTGGITRYGEGLAGEVTEADAIVPMGIEQDDPFAALQALFERRDERLGSILDRTQAVKQQTIEDNRNLSVKGNPNPVALEDFSEAVLFQPEASPLDFAEQVNTDGQMLTQASTGVLGHLGWFRLTKTSRDHS